MTDFELKIKILTDIVIEKNKYLTASINITHNQKILLKTPDSDVQSDVQIAEIFAQMNQEKKIALEKILENDQIFTNMFESLENFEENAKIHANVLRTLQQHIQETIDLDMQIRLAEEDNLALLKKKKSDATAPSPLAKKNVLEKYKSNVKKPMV